MKYTLILGASTNPQRYSYKAIKRLVESEHNVLAIGKRKGNIHNTKIETLPIHGKQVETVSLYLKPANQKAYYQYILNLKPKRVIFNPGSENFEFFQILDEIGISPMNACTLVMLSLGSY